jgi:hypothetical protein
MGFEIKFSIDSNYIRFFHTLSDPKRTFPI